MKRSAVGKAAAVGVLAVSILAGAVGLYYYTLTPVSTISATSSSSATTTGTSSPTGGGSSGISPGSCVTNSQGQCVPGGGQCATNAQGQCEKPAGVWASYLGYIPAGYTPAPHYSGAPTYPCPSGMNAAQCATFKQTCGNGVCDPNESCKSCPIDCGISGQLTCDPYTGRPGAPVTVCNVAAIG